MAETQDPQENLQAEALANFRRSVGLEASPDPRPVSTVSEGVDIRKNITGNPFSGANPGAQNPFGTADFAKAITNYVGKVGSQQQSELSYMKPFSYNGDFDGANFERYYNTKQFKELGFNPYRNNEALYNDKMTFGDEFTRAASQWPALLKSGFMSGVRSWKDMFSDPLAPDLASAKEMQKAMAIGSSTKGGVGSFVTNTFLNSAYTVGIGAELLLEELALAGATAATAGLVSGASMPAAFTRFLSAGSKIGRASEGSKEVIAGLKGVDISIDGLRTFWNTSGKGAAKIGGALNPLENTWEIGKEIVRGTNGLKYTGAAGKIDEFARWTDNFGKFAKDMLLIKSAVSESKLEGGMVELETVKDLSNKYREEHNGAEPTGADLENIQNIARGEAKRTALWNMPAILWSNKLMYETIFAPLEKGTARVASDIIIDEAGKAAIKAGKEGVAFKAVGEGMLERLSAQAKSLTKPKTYGKFAMGYLKTNFAEGVQENIQEAISQGSKEYAKALYDDPSRAAYEGYMGHFMSGIKDQFSAQGMETFAGGFLMGAMAQPIMSAPMWGGMQIWNNTIDKKNYEDYKKQRREQTENQVKSLNELYKNTVKYFAPELGNLAAQDNLAEDMHEAIKTANKNKQLDTELQASLEHIHTALQTGHYDEFIDRMKEIQKLSPDEVANGFMNSSDPELGQKVLSRMDKVIERAENIKKNYDAVNSSFPNPFNPGRFTSGTPEHKAQARGYTAWNIAQKHLIFATSTFNDYQQRVRDIADAFVSSSRPLEKAATTDLYPLLDGQTLMEKVKGLSMELGLLDPNIKEHKKQIAEKQKNIELLMEFHDSIFSEEQASPIDLSKIAHENVTSETIPSESYVSVEGKKGVWQLTNAVLDNTGKPKAYSLTDINTGEVKEFPVDEVTYLKPQEAKDLHADVADDRSRKAFSAYLRFLAKRNGDFFFNDKMNKAYQMIKDSLTIKNELEGLSRSINVLSDPKGFLAVYQGLEDTTKELQDKMLEDTKKRNQKFVKDLESNNALNTLAQAGAFPTPQYWSHFVKAIKAGQTPELPTQFIDISTSLPISEGEKFNKALDIWKSCLEAIKEEIVPQEKPKSTTQPPAPKPGPTKAAQGVTYHDLSEELQAELEDMYDEYLMQLNLKEDEEVTPEQERVFIAQPKVQEIINRKKTQETPKEKPAITDFNKLSPEEQFTQMYDVLSKGQDKTLPGTIKGGEGSPYFIQLDSGNQLIFSSQQHVKATNISQDKKAKITATEFEGEPAIIVTNAEGKEIGYIRKNPLAKAKPQVQVSDLEAKKADIERRRQEALFGNITPLEFETTDTKGRTRKTIVKTKVDENGFQYSFETTIDGKSSSTAHPKVTKQEFINSSIYKNLDQNSKEFIDELPEDAVILLQSIAISTDKNSAAGLGNGNITIGYVSKELGGRVDDIALKYQPNEINAKYDAELKALEQQPTSTTQTEIENKKADIERRRPTSYIRDSKDKKSPLETFRNEAKREWDGVSVITGDRMKNLYVGIQLFVEAYPEHKDLLDKFIKKENGTIGITNNNLSFVLNTLKKQGVTTESELGVKINAKYDAELAALESQTKLTPSSSDPQQETLDKVNNFFNSNKIEILPDGTRVINGTHYPYRVTSLIEARFKQAGKPEFDFAYLNNILELLKEKKKSKDFSAEQFISDLKKEPGIKSLFEKTEVSGVEEQILTPAKITKLLNGYDKFKGFKEDSSPENLERLLKDLYYKHTTDRGNTVDRIVRDFFLSGVVEKPEGISQDGFDSLMAILNQFKSELDTNNEIVLSSGLVVYGADTADDLVSGELDLLVVTPDGKLKIYDIKTADNWKSTKVGEKLGKYDYQLSVYKNLLEENTGIEVVGIGILPILTSTTPDGYIKDVANPQKDFPATNKNSLVRIRTYNKNAEKIVEKAVISKGPVKDTSVQSEDVIMQELIKEVAGEVKALSDYPAFVKAFKDKQGPIPQKFRELYEKYPHLRNAILEQFNALSAVAEKAALAGKNKENFEWVQSQGFTINFATNSQPSVLGTDFAITGIHEDTLDVVKGEESYTIGFDEVQSINQEKLGDVTITSEDKSAAIENSKTGQTIAGDIDPENVAKIKDMTKDQDQSIDDILDDTCS